jgi:hypothetical protein
MPERVLLQYYYIKYCKFVYRGGFTAMNNKNIETSNEQQYSFPRLKSYFIDEVLAAGGADAFAKKNG